MSRVIPRIRGKVGQATEGPPEVIGKWYFEIWVTPLGQGEVSSKDSLGLFGPWETEKIAHQELKTATELVCDKIEIEMTGKKSGQYIDMKTNEMRSWLEH